MRATQELPFLLFQVKTERKTWEDYWSQKQKIPDLKKNAGKERGTLETRPEKEY